MRYILTLLISLTFLSTKVFAQGEANKWYFGNGAGLDFNTNPPTQLEDGNATLGGLNFEGVGAVSDASGNLLFYTDGRSVFDKTHTAMAAGTGLLGGDGSSTQSGLVLPVNGSTSQYFVISTDDIAFKSYYSIVDMTLNGGLGNVSTKNSPLVTANCAEAIVAIPEYNASNNPTGENWIIFHDYNSNTYREYKTNGSSISLVNSYSVGFTIPSQSSLLLKTNGCFDKIAFSIYNSGRVEILPFNNVTGVIGAPSLILSGVTGGTAPTSTIPFINVEVYGIEFSPNEQFFYVTESGLNNRRTIHQFDISGGASGLNPASVLTKHSYYTGDNTVDRFGHLQLGPDGKIYCPGFAFSLPNYMSVVPTPNVAWTRPVASATDFLFKQFTYTVKRVGEGLPVFSQNLLRQLKIYYNNACEGGTTNFSFLFGGSAVSQSWDFGDPASGGLNTSTSASPSHIYAAAGTYTVTLSVTDNCGRVRTKTANVIIKSGPTYSLPSTTCPNTNIIVTGTGTNAANYTWSTSSTGSPVLATGTTYTYNGSLPATVYVQDPTPLATYTAGNTTAGQTQKNDVQDTQFDLFTTVSLTSFQAMTRTSGTTTVTIEKKTGSSWPGTVIWTSSSYTSSGGGSTATFTPNITLASGSYRIIATVLDIFSRNNTTNGTDIAGVINMIGDSDGGSKGGSYINLKINLPDPCGIRVIAIPLNCCVAPTITTQPSSQSVCPNTGVTFTVATSASSPTYQWQVSTDNGVTWSNIGGATSASYSIAAGSVTSSINNYRYRAVINPSGCFTNSNAATLTVNPIPSVTNSPLTASICEGIAWPGVTLTSAVSGTTFAWTSTETSGITGNAASGNGNLPTQTFSNSGATSGTVTYTITPTANSCPGSAVNYVVTVNPSPVITNTPLTTSICEGTAWTGLTLTADVTGTTFAWTSTATSGITGNTASGSGNLPSQTFSNIGTTSGTVTYAITPTAGTCTGNVSNYVVTVNPIPVITNSPLTASVCEGIAWSGVTFSADVTGTTFAWTSAATAGISGNTASGSSNLPSQTFSNSGTTSGTVTYAITPTASTCNGSVANYVVTVNPIPVITNSPLTATICEGTAWPGITMAADVTGTTFAWTSSASAGTTGNTASGSGNLPSQTFSNSGTASGTVTYGITPTAGTCSGTLTNYVVTVNPRPTITSSPLTASNCGGTAWTGVTLAADVIGTTYSWTSSATAGITGNTASGTSNIPSQTYLISGVSTGTVTYAVTPSANSCVGTVTNYVVTVNAPTIITTQPTGTTTICSGNAYNLSVVATGSGALTYQWYKGGSPISGATSSTFNTPSVSLTDAGTYTVTVTGACGTVTSNNAVLNVNGVSISTQPANQGPCIGGSATFFVTATGPGLTYQWKENTGSGFNNIGAATSSSYNIASVTAGMAGYQYQVVILSNGSCATTSGSAILTVNTSTTINSQPVGASLCVGDPLNLSVNASGSGTITYQWKKNGSPIGSANSLTYTIASVSASDAATYSVDVLSSCGPATSSNAVITVNNVSITSNPVSTTVCQGTNASFSVTATGFGTLSYQWQSDNGTGTFTNIASATSSTLSLNSVAISQSGYQYRVVIQDNGVCSKASAPATLTVNPTTTIGTQPTGANLCVGSALNLNIVASGAGTLTFQWKLNGSNVGTNSSSYSVPTVAAGDAGTYTVDVTGSCGIITSTNAIVKVNGVTISADPASVTKCENSNHTFSVSATGIGTLSYQWQTDNGTGTFTNIASATSSTLSLNSFAISQSGYQYRVVIQDNGACSKTSAPATLTVNPSTTIGTQPSGGNLCVGGALNLNVIASGAGTLNYQWKLNGTNVGTNSSSYSVPTVAAGDAGTYTVDVTGSCGIVTSINAIVIVNGVTISADPASVTKCENSSHTFSVSATGLGTLSYQWQTDNGTGTFTNISSATSSTLTLNSITLSQSGNKYRVVIQDNGACSKTSAAAILTVNSSTTIGTQPTGVNLCVGGALNLSVAATGAGTLTYQWKLNGSNVGTNSSSYSVPTVAAGDAGTYSVDVNGSCGSITSVNAIVTINEVTISADPASTSICENIDHTFNVNATGLGILSYQWQTDNGIGTFTNISGANSASYTVVAPTLSMSGYKYQVLVKDNNICPITSLSATLTVNPSVSIGTQPTGENICDGAGLSLSVSATGIAPITYQWNHNGSPISGATSSSYNVTSVTVADAGSYSVDITGSCGTVPSNTATIVVNKVTIGTAPNAQTACEGSNTFFDVIASGNGTLSYQWQTDNGTGTFVNLSGQTLSSLPLNSVTSSMNGNNYRVIVSDDACPSTSNSAQLTVNPATVINNQPSGVTLCGGQALNLSVSASGMNLTYQWKFNGSNIGSPTSNNTFNLTTPSSSDAGQYSVDVIGGCGTITSNAVAVIITSPTQNTQTVTGGKVCQGNTGIVTILSSQTGVQYEGFIGSSSVTGHVSGTGGDVTLNVNASSLLIGNNTISIYVYGCDSTILTSNATIVVIAKPTADAGIDISLNNTQPVTLGGTNTTIGSDYQYSWTVNGSAPFATTLITTATPITAINNYTLTVTTVNAVCPPVSDDILVKVDAHLLIPNIFSPNGDRQHDYLEIENIQYFPKAVLFVYNQWGELIFKSEKGYTNPWDGTRNGTDCEVSGYYYVLELNENGFKPMKGSITLVR